MFMCTGLAGFTLEQVEEVRCVIRMLPIFFTTILFWTIYAQVRHPCLAAWKDVFMLLFMILILMSS